MKPAEPYPDASLVEGLWDRWVGDDYALLSYLPRWMSDGDGASRLLIDFKNAVPEAEARIQELALDAVARWERTFRRRGVRSLVAVPSHAADAPEGPVQRLARHLAAEVPWLEYIPGLVRVTTVPKAARAAERPSVETHVASMRYLGPRRRDSDGCFMMLDDVITKGATSTAARQVLMAATGCPSVTGFFLARTVHRR